MSQDLRTRISDLLRTSAPHHHARLTYRLLEEAHDLMSRMVHAPIRMILACPSCLRQHIDEPDAPDKYCITTADGDCISTDPRCMHQINPVPRWENPPHRTHKCQHCGYLWRPSDVPTEGVASLVSRGANDGRALPEVVTIESRQKELHQWYDEWHNSAQGVIHGPTAKSFLNYCLTRLCSRTL